MDVTLHARAEKQQPFLLDKLTPPAWDVEAPQRKQVVVIPQSLAKAGDDFINILLANVVNIEQHALAREHKHTGKRRNEFSQRQKVKSAKADNVVNGRREAHNLLLQWPGDER
jgi:hypothetical protein